MCMQIFNNHNNSIHVFTQLVSLILHRLYREHSNNACSKRYHIDCCCDVTDFMLALLL